VGIVVLSRLGTTIRWMDRCGMVDYRVLSGYSAGWISSMRLPSGSLT
jgi:hypothetical protein